jgi:hypothetical protein
MPVPLNPQLDPTLTGIDAPAAPGQPRPQANPGIDALAAAGTADGKLIAARSNLAHATLRLQPHERPSVIVDELFARLDPPDLAWIERRAVRACCCYH